SGRKALEHRLCVVNPIDLSELRRRLDDEHDADVVTGKEADRLGDDRKPAERRKLIQHHHDLVLQLRVALWELSSLKPDRLLEEEIQHGAEPMEVIRID